MLQRQRNTPPAGLPWPAWRAAIFVTERGNPRAIGISCRDTRVPKPCFVTQGIVTAAPGGRNFRREDATAYQRSSNASLLSRV
jgi:hypothetical protein